MRQQDFVYTRREFLRSVVIAGLGLTIPQFLTETASAATAAGTMLPGVDQRILVVIQLGGGNDGLNTVVPHGDDAYWKARKAIAPDRAKLLRIDDMLALNGRMGAMKDLYDDGQLAIVNGVGYPNPNRSHFRSMEIWHTGTDSDRYSLTGWVGRYFDNCCPGKPDPVSGVFVGGDTPQAFEGQKGVGVSFQQPSQFRWLGGQASNTRDALDAMNPRGGEHDQLDFLRHVSANAMVSSDKVLKSSRAGKVAADYPNSRLGGQLKSISTLIAGGLPTRIYYTSISGFDTHANQNGVQDNLLEQFSAALAAFMKDMKAQGLADRVMVMAFSEFGRRVEENASRGTDHGTAGPVFLAGAAGLTPGLHSSYPSLTDLSDGDLKHTIDFRSVYTDLLAGWLGADPQLVLGREFPRPGIIG